jgi:hypothetical protein
VPHRSLLAALCLALGFAALAPTAGHAALGDTPSRQELLDMLAQRDAAIAALARRLERLERIVGQSADAAAPAPQPSAQAEAPPVATPPGRTEPPAPDQDRPQPGAVEVDLVAAERALERTLVSRGISLLPEGAVELEPSFSYSFADFDYPSLTPSGPDTLLTETRVEHHVFEPELKIRAGLPLESQVEVSVPYTAAYQETEIASGGGALRQTDSSGSAPGDVRVALAKTLWHEDGWRPEAVARVSWDTATGAKTAGGIPLGGGFDELEGELTFIARQDPMVFFGSASYQTAFADGGIEPGDEFAFGLGAALAVTPLTSLSFSIDNRFIDDTKVGGADVPGSDAVAVTASLGLSTLLGRDTLLSLAAGFGLTEDATDYSFVVALPVRLQAFE